jgi:hypothetical protein
MQSLRIISGRQAERKQIQLTYILTRQIYRMGHEKVARLILFDVSMYIA